MDSTEKLAIEIESNASLTTTINNDTNIPSGLNNETSCYNNVPQERNTCTPLEPTVEPGVLQNGSAHVDDSFPSINLSTINTSLPNQHREELTYDLSHSFNKFSEPNSRSHQTQGMYIDSKAQSTMGVLQATPQNVYTYPHISDGRGLTSAQPAETSTLQNLLPPEENVYQSLQPIPHDLFNVPSTSEIKVYEQLQPVQQNKYRMPAEPKVYQELKPLPVGGSRMQNVEGRVYQELTPLRHPGGMQSNTRTFHHSNSVTSTYDSTHYGSSKLYQQLSQPSRMPQQSEAKTYHELKPVTMNNYGQSRQPYFKHPQQQVYSYPPGTATVQSRLNSYPRPHRTDDMNFARPHQDTNVRLSMQHSNINNDTRWTSGTQLTNEPHQSEQGGFHLNKPKIYLELRNPTMRHHATAKSERYAGVNTHSLHPGQHQMGINDMSRTYQQLPQMARPMVNVNNTQNNSQPQISRGFSKMLNPNSPQFQNEQVLNINSNQSVVPTITSQRNVAGNPFSQRYTNAPVRNAYQGDTDLTSKVRRESMPTLQGVPDSVPSSTSNNYMSSSPTSKLQELLLRTNSRKAESYNRLNSNHTSAVAACYQPSVEQTKEFWNKGELNKNFASSQEHKVEKNMAKKGNVYDEKVFCDRSTTRGKITPMYNATNTEEYIPQSGLSMQPKIRQPNINNGESLASNMNKKGRSKIIKNKDSLENGNKVKRKYTKTEKFYRRFKKDIVSDIIIEPIDNVKSEPDVSDVVEDIKISSDLKDNESTLDSQNEDSLIQKEKTEKRKYVKSGKYSKRFKMKTSASNESESTKLGKRKRKNKRKYTKTEKFFNRFKRKKLINNSVQGLNNSKEDQAKNNSEEEQGKKEEEKGKYNSEKEQEKNISEEEGGKNNGEEDQEKISSEIETDLKSFETTSADHQELEKTELNETVEIPNSSRKRKYRKRKDKVPQECKETDPTNSPYQAKKRRMTRDLHNPSSKKFWGDEQIEIKRELIDPLEEGLVSDDDGDVVFLGFDMPDEEDDTILGFDCNSNDQDTANNFLERLEADCVTVECDPGSLLATGSSTISCSLCGVCCNTHVELVAHMQWHATANDTAIPLSDSSQRFSCPLCPKRFTTSAYAKKHMAVSHREVDLTLTTFYCGECSLTFPSEKLWKAHENKVHNKALHQCDKCLKFFIKFANLQRHKRSHVKTKKAHPCAYCSQKFSSKELLQAHRSVHSDKIFKCDTCSKKLTTATSLKRHRLIHVKEKLFRCEICQKSFNTLSTLKTHLLIHTGVRRFPCNLCHKVFNRRDVLNAHQWVHTGEKNFKCDICSQKFRWRHAVKSHKLIYHTTEKPFSCETCGKSFSHPDSFKKHAEVHAEKLFYCQICLKSFSRNSSLKYHLITHSDLKPFFCNVCNKGFRSKNHLQNHFLVHTQEKPWLCKFCNKTYKDRNQLRRHKRVVHCKAIYSKSNLPQKMKTEENFEILAANKSDVV